MTPEMCHCDIQKEQSSGFSTADLRDSHQERPGAQVSTGRFLKWRVTLTEGSREMILTVLSTSPTARKRDRCSPGGTLARLMHTTSADISFRSVYSFSCPDCKSEDKRGHKPLPLTPNHGLRNWRRIFKFLFTSSHSSYYNQ